MKKVLFISNITNKMTNFALPIYETCKKLGIEFHLASNLDNFDYDNNPYKDIKLHNIKCARNPFSFKNIASYKEVNRIIHEENIDMIHCNTPIGGVLGRICGHKNKVPKVIYTAHGFHFFKGAPLFNNTILKWAEYLMAHWTDIIITINEEDYQAAKRMKLKKGGKVYKVNGVGVNIEEYQNVEVDKDEYRKQLGLKNDDFVCIAMGDLVKRKNFSEAIEVIASLKNSKVHYLICGEGPEKDKLQKLARKLNIEKQIHFLGYRSDIKELLKISDCFLFLSKQEGLPRSTMEAMASGLPCVVSKIRGHVDLLGERNNIPYEKNLTIIIHDENKKIEMCEMSTKFIKKYNVKLVKDKIRNIYEENI